MAYYLNLTEVPNTDCEAYIYQIEGSVKGIWYTRIKRMTSNGYFRKTLKTKSMTEAFKRANRYWLEVRDAEDRDIILTPGSQFQTLALKWLDYRDKRSNANNIDRSVRYQFHNYYFPYFGNDSVEHMTDKRYIDYLNDYRLQNPARKKPKLNTLCIEQQHLNSFLNWCYENHYTRRRIRLSKLEHKATRWIRYPHLVDTGSKSRRDLATWEVYQYFRDYFDHGTVWSHPRIKQEPFHVTVNRKRSSFYMKTLYNLCCRPGEELLMSKWGDLSMVASNERKGAYYVRLDVKHGKKVRKNRYDGQDTLTYVSDYRYVKMLATWKAFLEEFGFPTDDDAFIFPLKKGRQDTLGRRLRARRNMPEEYYTNWDSIAAGAHIKRTRPLVLEWRRSKGPVSSTLEQKIMRFTWYSVRHVAIKRMLMESKYPIHYVAEKANTGITMITDFYFKYMEEPEGRIVSRHPAISEDKREIQVFNEDDIKALNTLKRYKND
jgi:hypothetical protein